MTRRRKRLAAALLALTLAGVGAVVFWPRMPLTMVQRMKLARVGMTRAEVEATVGGPPGYYSPAGSFYGPSLSPEFQPHEEWLCDGGRLLVLFDADGRAAAVRKFGTSLSPPAPTLRERFRDWRKRLGL